MNYPPDHTRVIPIIYTSTRRRGNGKEIPIRVVTEIFDFDGQLIADKDPFSFTIEQLNEAFTRVTYPLTPNMVTNILNKLIEQK